MVRRGSFTETFNPAQPWGAVIQYSAYGAGQDGDWWKTHLELPVLTGATLSGTAAKVAAVDGGNHGRLRPQLRGHAKDYIIMSFT